MIIEIMMQFLIDNILIIEHLIILAFLNKTKNWIKLEENIYIQIKYPYVFLFLIQYSQQPQTYFQRSFFNFLNWGTFNGIQFGKYEIWNQKYATDVVDRV